MRYRALSEDGDYTFGQSEANFLINSPAAVAQAVKTRLLLFTGEWFLDTTEGTPWAEKVLGTGTKAFYDRALQERTLDTDGVTAIEDYSSSLDPATRHLSVTMTISTAYGQASVDLVF
jgi:hypothetical protein